MEFRVLGPVELWHGGQRATLGHAKQRSVLAVLLMEAGRVVPTGVLIDRVWDHRPPDAALNVLYGYVARLRKALTPAGAWLARESGGYLLDIAPDLVDAHRFTRLVAEAASTTPVDRAVTRLDEALALWRGTPCDGCRPSSSATSGTWEPDGIPTSSANSWNWSVPAPSTSGSSVSSCWPCAARAGPATRWSSTGWPGGGYGRSGAPIRARCCARYSGACCR
jgi:hypothetical protein